MSWIHIDDIVGIFRLLHRERQRPPVRSNGTAPNPVRNAEFARTFSSVLKKPYTPWRFYLPFGPPDGLLRLALGEVATVITTGQRVLPDEAAGAGIPSSSTRTSPTPCATSSRRPRRRPSPSRIRGRPMPAAHH